jgi:signal transduction histidine kinase
MSIFWRKYWIPGFMGIVLILGLIAILEVFSEIGEPFGGFYAYRNHASNRWRVEASTPPWWLERTALKYQDILITIQGHPYDHQARRYYKAAHESGIMVDLTVDRNGELLELEIPTQEITLGAFFDIKLPDIICGIGFWWLAVIVYRARPDDPVNRLFAIATSLSAASIWLSIPTFFPESDLPARLNAAGWAITTAFLGASFIHMAMLFPVKVRRLGAGWVTSLYLVMGIIAAIFVTSMLLRWQGLAPSLMERMSTTGNILVIGGLGLGVDIFSLRLASLLGRRNVSRRQKRQVSFLFWGVLLAVPYILVVVLRVTSQVSASYFTYGLDLRYLVLAVPLSFAFVVLRYQTFQNPHPSLVGVFLLASSALFASFGAWVFRLIDPQWVNSLNWTPFVPIFLATLLSGLFWSAQTSWFGAFTRLFNWEQRSYEAVQHFAHQTVREIDITDLPNVIAKSLVENMELERAVVWLWHQADKVFELTGMAGELPHLHNNHQTEQNSSQNQTATSSIPQRIAPGSGPLFTETIRLLAEGTELPDYLIPLQQTGAIEVIMPLTMHDRPVGLLGLGKRWDDEIFDTRDLVIVDLIAQQAALFLLTALQVEQLRQVPEQIASAQERERFKIAQELHDTVQQFLGSLPFYLQTSREAIQGNPDEADAVLGRCINEVESAAQTVRQIRNNLSPLQLEDGLIRPIETLVDNFRLRTGLVVRLEITPEVDATLTPGDRHALFRVAQQALDNIAAHAGASQVDLKFEHYHGRVYFEISDDGRGSSEKQRALALEQGSFGLTSMQARIAARGGGFSIDSAPGQGTCVSGWLPTNHR